MSGTPKPQKERERMERELAAIRRVNLKAAVRRWARRLGRG